VKSQRKKYTGVTGTNHLPVTLLVKTLVDGLIRISETFARPS